MHVQWFTRLQIGLCVCAGVGLCACADQNTTPPAATTATESVDTGQAQVVTNDTLQEIKRDSPDTTSTLQFDGAVVFPVAKDGKWGLVNSTGNWVAKPEFEWIDQFADKMALARLDSSLGYIDTSGHFRAMAHNPFGLQRDEMTSGLQYSQGLAVQFDKTGKCGYIDFTGNFKIAPKFDYAWPFGEDGKALVKMGQRFGVINLQGEFVLRPILTSLATPGQQPLAEGLEPMRIRKKWGYVDRESRLRIQAKYTSAERFHEGYAVVGTATGLGYINTDGEVITWLDFTQARAFQNGRAAVKYDNKWGFIDTSGQVVVLPKYDQVLDFRDSIAIVAEAGQWGVINRNGQVVMPLKYNELTYTRLPEVLRVRRGKRWGLRRLNATHYLVYPQFDTLKDYSEDFAAAHKAYVGWGFVNRRGLLICPMRFDAVEPFNGGMAAVQLEGQWGFIDTMGRWVILPQYESVSAAYVQQD